MNVAFLNTMSLNRILKSRYFHVICLVLLFIPQLTLAQTHEPAGKGPFHHRDIIQKVYSIGNSAYFTDSCSFYFECDCCKGELALNPDSTYYLVTYCLNKSTLSSGRFRLNRDSLTLVSDGVSVSRIYNEWQMVDSTAVKYIYSDSVEFSNTSLYKLSECGSKVKMVTTFHRMYAKQIAIEEEKDYTHFLLNLEADGLMKRLNTLQVNNPPLFKPETIRARSLDENDVRLYDSLDKLFEEEGRRCLLKADTAEGLIIWERKFAVSIENQWKVLARLPRLQVFGSTTCDGENVEAWFQDFDGDGKSELIIESEIDARTGTEIWDIYNSKVLLALQTFTEWTTKKDSLNNWCRQDVTIAHDFIIVEDPSCSDNEADKRFGKVGIAGKYKLVSGRFEKIK
jgi:hypothetical protein